MHEFSSDNIDEMLTILLTGGSLTPSQSVTMEAWLAESEDNRSQLEGMLATWQLLGKRSVSLPGYRPIEPKVLPLRHRSAVARSIYKWRRTSWIALGAAAALGTFVIQRTLRGEADAFQYSVAKTEPTSNIRLEDGTVVRLAPGSRLKVTHNSHGRDAHLDGQAFFAVTHMAGRPFRVHTSSGDVKVLGTRFAVTSDRARTDLVVVDGRVELSTGARRVEVVGGEVSSAERGAVAPAVAVTDVYARLSWMGGTMLFNSTPLPSVAAEIAHRFGVRVDVDPSLRQHTLTAVFNGGSLTDVLDVICRVVDVRCETSPDGATILISPQRAPASRKR
ncbi:MAG TPA: FecR domain-containing protein [Gemmatimonadaceae bacterium]|nr:FecR domain-containing protein [Gemmatimonadaceae bacterium]